MNVRPIEVVGALAVVVGFGALASEALANTFSLTSVFVTIVGLLAAVQGLRFGLERRQSEHVQTETDDPERRYQAPVPGADVDESLAEARGFSRRSTRVRDRLTDDVREVTLEALLARGDYTRERAEAALRDGTWTDDQVAAWFLGDDLDLPLEERIRGLFRRESAFQLGARRAIDATARLQEGDS